MTSIKDAHFYNSRVFVRLDLNVPIAGGRVLDDLRIRRSLETILFLKKSGAKLVLATHLGRPQEEDKKKKEFSLVPVKEKLEELLGEKIAFSKKLGGIRLKMKIRAMKPGQVLLLENLRFDKREERGDRKFAEELAGLVDAYVGEAFSVCHRPHASVAILPRLLPHFAGFELIKEVEMLSKISQNPVRPLCVIIGGIKIDSKLKMLEKFLNFADHLIFGGEIANVILRVKGISVGRPWPEEKIVRIIEKIDLTNPKIHLPVDVLAAPDTEGEIYVRETAPGSLRKEENSLDIGEESIAAFSAIIKASRTIFWSGPLGFFENEKFSRGTRKIAEVLAANQKAFRVVGGGETASAVEKFGLSNKIDFISNGGGAMLEFLAGEKLPGLEALE